MTEWLYLPKGGPVHQVEDRAARALCGVEVWRSEDWYGTGSQAEYESAAARPKCRRCLARGAR